MPTGSLAGTVAALRERTETENWGEGSTSEHVVSFRIERRDPNGQPLAPVPVEIRGRSLEGSLSEGDWVAVRRAWRPGTTLKVDKIDNLTTGAPFGVRPRGRLTTILGGLIVSVIALLILAVFIFVGYAIISDLMDGGLGP